MNDIFSSLNVVLAHGFDISRDSGVSLLIIMSLFVFVPLFLKKSINMPKGLWASSIVPYVLVSINVLQLSCGLYISKTTEFICLMAIGCPNFFLMLIFGSGIEFFMAAFVIDTLCIFAIVRLTLFIKYKFSSKKNITLY
jgi:hypothetical protein